jgi:hypothetical protein
MARHDLLLARLPDFLVGHARAIVDRLVGDTREFAELGPGDVQRFLWSELPTRWGVASAEWSNVVEAGAQIFELARRPGLAAIARSAETREILQAYERSLDDGAEMARAALVRTGTAPPDTETLTWGAQLAGREAEAHEELSRVLEVAVVVGDVRPASPGWRTRHRDLTERWLTTSSRRFDGGRPLDVIHAARRERWASSGTPARRALLAHVETLTSEPVPVPDGEPAPMTWLLNRIGAGVQLTGRGYLPPAVVREADECFGWSLRSVPANREVHLPPLADLRTFATRQRLVVKRRDTLRLSERGRRLLHAPGRLWEHTAVAWLGEHVFDIRVAEVAAALVLRTPTEAESLIARTHQAVAPEFRTKDGTGVPLTSTSDAVWRWYRRGLALGYFDRRALGMKTYTQVGRLAALTALRARSHAPAV